MDSKQRRILKRAYQRGLMAREEEKSDAVISSSMPANFGTEEHKVFPKEWRLWLWAVAMGIATALIATRFTGRGAETAVSIALAILLFLLVYPLRNLPWILNGATRNIRAFRWIVSVGLCCILTTVLGIISWPPPDELSSKIDRILEILKANKEQTDTSLPGWSLHMLINLHDLKTNQKETIYDDSNLSVYLSAEKYLTLAVKDANGEMTEIRAPFGQKDGAPKDEIMLLSLQMGLTGKATILEIDINGKKVAQETLSGWIKPNPSSANVNPLVGCDVSGFHCARFELYGMAVHRRTLTTQEMYETAAGFKGNHPGINYPLPPR
jgi:hypothetical protein